MVTVSSAHAQISTETDAGFIQLTPAQEKAVKKAEKSPERQPKIEIKAGKESYVPAPKTEDPKNGTEICDIVAGIIARDFRVIVSNPHSSTMDIQTVRRGPYDVAIKSIVPYSNVYTAMGCDGKKLQDKVAGVLRAAMAENNKK